MATAWETPLQSGVGSARDMYPLIKPWPFQEPPLLISGNKFDDRNGNGEKDPDEAGLSGWKIMLAGPGDLIEPSTPTDQDFIPLPALHRGDTQSPKR